MKVWSLIHEVNPIQNDFYKLIKQTENSDITSTRKIVRKHEHTTEYAKRKQLFHHIIIKLNHDCKQNHIKQAVIGSEIAFFDTIF